MRKISIIFILVLGGCIQWGENPDHSISPVVLTSPTGMKSSLPYLHVGADGNLYLLWLNTDADNSANLKMAKWQNDSVWTSMQNITQGQDWFNNWADYPQIQVNDQGEMISHILGKSAPDTYAYDVHLMIKPAQSDRWSIPVIPHQDSTKTEHGFVSYLAMSNGFLVTWLDGRNTNPENHHHASTGAMTLRTAFVDIEGNVTGEKELDNRVCDCCQTSAANGALGPVIVYRDRSSDEIRDIAIVRNINGIWTTPEIIFRDNWHIVGCPVNGPRVAAFQNIMAVTWFTEANDQSQIKIAFSENDGATFEPPFTIDGEMALGRLDLVIVDSTTAAVSWMDVENNLTFLKIAFIHKDKGMLESHIITEMDPSRKSGFPQMEIFNRALYLAFTDTGQEVIRLMKINLK